MKQDIILFDIHDLEKAITALNEKPFHARQLFKWIYQKDSDDFSKMTDIGKNLRIKLADTFYISNIKLEKLSKSNDQTIKFLFDLGDGFIESVYIPEDDRSTLCLSTQIGCPLACSFCVTGTLGFKRNLEVNEIINQFRFVSRYAKENNINPVSNLVFMGMGEPLLNLDHVIKAINILIDHNGASLGKRKITVSTSGIIPKILEFGEKADVNLAVSINAPDEVKRSKLMPINKKYPLKELINTLQKYPLAKRKRITIEYILIKDVNDSILDAKNLVKLLSNLAVKINLISYNENNRLNFAKPSFDTIQNFQKFLLEKNFTVILRKSRGTDISAACGQLNGQ
jgi:23S rRNA (adenine2503-C2)-methyltransferase